MASKSRAPRSANAPSGRRAEKLSALEALLGPDAMDRLRRHDEGFAPAPEIASHADQDRVAWQRNRLIERLRARLPATGATAAQPSLAVRATPESVDTRIAAAVDLSTLADEHPAVIVRVLETLDRDQRVTILRALPGPTARAAIRRLRTTK